MPNYDAIDDAGDLELVVGAPGSAEQTTFKVSRAVMRLSSPVWNAMLAGNFSEASVGRVNLADDHPTGLHVLLLLAHHQYGRLPARPTSQVLVEIAELCDKYDMYRLARNFIASWLKVPAEDLETSTAEFAKGFNEVMSEKTKIVRARCCVWVGWICKNFAWWDEGMCSLLRTLAPVHFEDLSELPPGCRDFVIKDVTTTMSKVLDLAYTALNSAQFGGQPPPCSSQEPARVVYRCNIIRLGLITKFLSDAALPLSAADKPVAKDVKCSLDELEKICQAVRLDDDDMNDFGNYTHNYCYVEFDRLLSTLYIHAQEWNENLEKEFVAFFPVQKAEKEVRAEWLKKVLARPA